MSRQRILRVVVLVFAVLAVVLAGACVYQYAAAATAARAIIEQRDSLEQTERYLTELARAQAEGRRISEQIPRRSAPWSWSEQLPVMVTQISGLVEKSGGQIDTMQPAPAVEREHLTRFPLRLTLRSDLARMTDIMDRFREAIPILSVDHFAIRAGQKPGDPLQVELTLSSYVIVEGQAAGGKP
jgi:Tfp pilus assembly protein PilO